MVKMMKVLTVNMTPIRLILTLDVLLRNTFAVNKEASINGAINEKSAII